jgi:hypothetical protein
VRFANEIELADYFSSSINISASLSLTFFILNFSLYILDGIATLHLKGDCLPSERFHKDLHVDRILKLIFNNKQCYQASLRITCILRMPK